MQTLKVDPALDEKLTTKGPLGSEHPLWSFSIVTTPASKDFEWLHDRQPVIIVSEDHIAKWLDPDTDKWTKELSQIVQPSETHPTLQWQVNKKNPNTTYQPRRGQLSRKSGRGEGRQRIPHVH